MTGGPTAEFLSWALRQNFGLRLRLYLRLWSCLNRAPCLYMRIWSPCWSSGRVHELFAQSCCVVVIRRLSRRHSQRHQFPGSARRWHNYLCLMNVALCTNLAFHYLYHFGTVWPAGPGLPDSGNSHRSDDVPLSCAICNGSGLGDSPWANEPDFVHGMGTIFVQA